MKTWQIVALVTFPCWIVPALGLAWVAFCLIVVASPVIAPVAAGVFIAWWAVRPRRKRFHITGTAKVRRTNPYRP